MKQLIDADELNVGLRRRSIVDPAVPVRTGTLARTFTTIDMHYCATVCFFLQTIAIYRRVINHHFQAIVNKYPIDSVIFASSSQCKRSQL